MIIMRCCCLSNNVASKWQRNTARITSFIRKNLSCSIFTDDYRCCFFKIKASICFLCQGRFQISGKTCSCQQISICLSIVGCFDNLEWLFDHLLTRSTFPLHFSSHVSFIVTFQIMLLGVCQISGWRCDLFYIVLSKIQTIYRCLSFFICCKGCNLFSSFIDNAGCSVRMHNIFTSI